MVLNPYDDNRSSWLNHYGYLDYLSIVWWLLSSYPCIDPSTGGYEEEEENIYGEEEEHFDHCTNQGKLIPMQALLVQAIP